MDIVHFKRLLILKPKDKTGEVLKMEIMWVAQNTLNLALNREHDRYCIYNLIFHSCY